MSASIGWKGRNGCSEAIAASLFAADTSDGKSFKIPESNPAGQRFACITHQTPEDGLQFLARPVVVVIVIGPKAILRKMKSTCCYNTDSEDATGTQPAPYGNSRSAAYRVDQPGSNERLSIRTFDSWCASYRC